MKYKKYFRKTSLKQRGHGDFFLQQVKTKKPKIFLEIGVFHGVTARNICELLYQIHKGDFKYIGLDLFAVTDENKSEIIPKTNFSNPLKNIYFRYIKKQDPYSVAAVEDLLKKFKNNVHLIKGNSNKILKNIDMSKIDYVFLDGGHDYDTVKNDLNNCIEVVNNSGTILCDDYNLSYAPGVKKAIDEFVEKNNFYCEIMLNNRFAKIEKNSIKKGPIKGPKTI
tara:strand:+ start:478 stop:1146 length:669 start_codon:yes stop_codon:yes gene_type:complete